MRFIQRTWRIRHLKNFTNIFKKLNFEKVDFYLDSSSGTEFTRPEVNKVVFLEVHWLIGRHVGFSVGGSGKK